LRRKITLGAGDQHADGEEIEETASATSASHQRVEVGAEFFDEALGRHGRAVHQGADGLRLHLTRNLVDVVHVLLLALAGDDLVGRRESQAVPSRQACTAAALVERSASLREGVRHVTDWSK